MSVPYEAPTGPPGVALAEPTRTARRTPDPSDARVALVVALVLAVVGALLGLVWSAWSPPGPAAEVLGGGSFAVLEESESAIAGDGRYLVIVTAVGLVAALAAWFGLRARRGATLLFGLVVGAVGGALLTELVGHLTGGGSFSGKLYPLTDGSRREVTLHLPLSLHLSGLVLIEPALIALVYGVLVAFTERDDLGRPDQVRDLLRPGPPQEPHGAALYPAPPYPQQPYAQPQYPPQPYGQPQYPPQPYAQPQYPPQPANDPQPPYPPQQFPQGDPSIHPGDHPQYGGGHGDAPGAAQQRDLPPQ